MRERDNAGREDYGTPLRAYNGRDALKDAYEEALDLAVYLRQAIEERDLARRAILHSGTNIQGAATPVRHETETNSLLNPTKEQS